MRKATETFTLRLRTQPARPTCKARAVRARTPTITLDIRNTTASIRPTTSFQILTSRWSTYGLRIKPSHQKGQFLTSIWSTQHLYGYIRRLEAKCLRMAHPTKKRGRRRLNWCSRCRLSKIILQRLRKRRSVQITSEFSSPAGITRFHRETCRRVTGSDGRRSCRYRASMLMAASTFEHINESLRSGWSHLNSNSSILRQRSSLKTKQ